MIKNSRTIWLYLTVAYMLAVLYVSTVPGVDPEAGSYSPQMEAFKNFLHFPAYGLMSFLLLRSFSKVEIKAKVAAFLMATGWGILNEFVQAQVPNRYWSLEDMCVNALGAGVVVLLIKR